MYCKYSLEIFCGVIGIFPEGGVRDEAQVKSGVKDVSGRGKTVREESDVHESEG